MNPNEILSKLFSDPSVASGLGGLFSDFQSQNIAGNGGALDLSAYTRQGFQGYNFDKGGVVGDKEKRVARSEAERIIEEMGMDLSDYAKYRDLVIHHETGGTFDPKQLQMDNGPGRGLFQFEKDSAKTAAERLKTYYKNRGEVPEWLNDVEDATTLTPAQQEILFTGQMMAKVKDKEKGYKVRLSGTFNRDKWETEDFTEAWIDNHNKTVGSERKDRIAKFRRDAKILGDKAGSLFTSEVFTPFVSSEAKHRNVDPLAFLNAGVVPEAGLGGLFKEIGKGAKKFWKKPFKTLGQGLLEGVKGSGDFLLSGLGMGDVINDSFVDKDKTLSTIADVSGVVGRTALDVFVPGAGTALGQIGGAINSGVNNGRANRQMEAQQAQFNNSAQGGMQELMSILGGGFTGMGPQQNPMGLLSSLFGGSFDNGGIVESVPEGLEAIQTERYRGHTEQIVLPDGMITDVNATKSHEKMEDGEVTDVVPEGTYIASSRPSMKFKRSELEDIIFGYKSMPYEEHAKGRVPEKISAADIIPKGQKKILPSEYAKRIKKTFEVRNQDDMFTNAANTENLASRIPYLEVLVGLGERNREKEQAKDTEEFRYGGYVKPRKASAGLIAGIGSALGVVGGITTGIGQMANIKAQKKALEARQAALARLSGNLSGYNTAGMAAGIAGQLAQETSLPSLNLDYSRLENFDTSTPQSFIDAQAAPNVDIASMIDRLGNRGGIAALANINAQSTNSRNAAAQQAFSQQRSADFNIANTITQGENREEEYNNNLRQQEVAARNNVFNNIAGQVQGGLQNQANIDSQMFSAETDFALQRAGLVGQGAAAVGNTITGIGGVLNSSADQFSDLFGSLGGGSAGGGAFNQAQGPAQTMSRQDILGSFNLPQNIINPLPQTTLNTSPLPDLNARYFPTDLFGNNSNLFPTNLFRR